MGFGSKLEKAGYSFKLIFLIALAIIIVMVMFFMLMIFIFGLDSMCYMSEAFATFLDYPC
ncbi:MAG: hypothetical protein COB91_05155 [Nitrosopumilales archaeon]|jgi:hypothetical protein|nr:hypothetical protein [Marine Group I thaumarchaeote]PBO83180.1 MAG: hypothetical protein COB91_05155 [Nitrosopumilales archaeon]